MELHLLHPETSSSAHSSFLLRLLLGDRLQTPLQDPDRLLLLTEPGAEVTVVVTELQVPPAQVQNLLTILGVL